LADLRKWFFDVEWHDVYDLLEFIAEIFPIAFEDRPRFLSFCNSMLERELSAYRFVGMTLTPVTSQEEMDAIGAALSVPDPFKSSRVHIERALALLSDREVPDYRNSVKESISAVEATCRIITQDGKATLGDALTELERKQVLHPALKKSFSSLYGYTNDAEGIRHALLEEARLGFDDAKFMLVCCSAFVSFLIAKTSE
jgi:hypothetical protein